MSPEGGDYARGGGGGDRTPPQDNDAEQSVIGSMLLSKDAVADVIETVRGTDFYRPAHETIFDAIVDLYGRGEPADPVTVAAELQRRGELGRIGGAPYLHTLSASVPIAANASYYAEIVREKAVLRRLVGAGTRIAQWGYSGEGEVDDLVDRAQAEVYAVTDKRTAEDYAPLSEIMEATLDEIEAISNRDGEMVGVPTGFADLDELTNGLHGGQMIIVAARPAMGKSTLALDFCRSASVHHNLASVIFSLEMTRNEITMRLLSAEGKIPLNHMRNGHMGDEDWAKLARKMGEVSSAPLFIDDSPNMTMMEIRAKARRLKQRHDLRLIVIDYLQLMSSGKKVESRQLEVSEFSRQIKLLAKELDVPIIALSQLNRGPEQRADKRPMMSDLRESGCVTADTRVMRADTNAEVTIGELMESGAEDIPVWALDERLKLVPRTMTHAFPSGVKDVYRLRLTSGREIKATGNHPFLTLDGWRPLAELAEGSRIGSIRHVPPPLEIRARDHEEVALLGHLIGLRSHERSVPDWVFSLPKEQVAVFLRNLWATDGCVDTGTTGNGRISYASTSRRLVDDVARLLLRFNVFTRVTHTKKDDHRDCFQLDITGAENQLRFIDDVGVHGARGVSAESLAHSLRKVTANPNLDTVPVQIWDRVKEVLADRQTTHGESTTAMGTAFGGSTTGKQAPGRQRLAEVATVLEDADLEVVATNDVFWDEVAEIELVGTEKVYDATVMGVHNFVANGMPIHNSIEQDADMVILLHREDAYEKESTRPGEADLIVAKHRNGPTRDVVVAFQGHYSRFVDMAHG
ncbi:MAG TPA: replicative DNA helicase [Nocardioidaceae bacterium]|nr:replicative DNA helicase [Nocardioidaceae bacterium]